VEEAAVVVLAAAASEADQGEADLVDLEAEALEEADQGVVGNDIKTEKRAIAIGQKPGRWKKNS
jgi:hypothetical protein